MLTYLQGYDDRENECTIGFNTTSERAWLHSLRLDGKFKTEVAACRRTRKHKVQQNTYYQLSSVPYKASNVIGRYFCLSLICHPTSEDIKNQRTGGMCHHGLFQLIGEGAVLQNGDVIVHF